MTATRVMSGPSGPSMAAACAAIRKLIVTVR
jgi:hypothetical protein